MKTQETLAKSTIKISDDIIKGLGKLSSGKRVLEVMVEHVACLQTFDETRDNVDTAFINLKELSINLYLLAFLEIGNYALLRINRLFCVATTIFVLLIHILFVEVNSLKFQIFS